MAGTLSRASPRLCRAPDGKRPSACGGRAIYGAGARASAQADRGDEGQAFYTGGLAESMAAHARKHGGALTVADLAQHKADWLEPLAQDYRGDRLHERSPHCQGLGAPLALG